MPYEWIFENLGGGLVGLLGVLLTTVSIGWWRDMRGQIRDLKADNRELRDTLNRLTDVAESWMPEQQHRRLKRP